MTGTEGSGPLDAAAARLVGELTAGPRGAGDPRTTEETRRYLKSDLQHYGVKTPGVRKRVADTVRAHGPLDHPQPVSRARALWHPEVHESRITAAILLERHLRVLEARGHGISGGPAARQRDLGPDRPARRVGRGPPAVAGAHRGGHLPALGRRGTPVDPTVGRPRSATGTETGTPAILARSGGRAHPSPALRKRFHPPGPSRATPPATASPPLDTPLTCTPATVADHREPHLPATPWTSPRNNFPSYPCVSRSGHLRFIATVYYALRRGPRRELTVRLARRRPTEPPLALPRFRARLCLEG